MMEFARSGRGAMVYECFAGALRYGRAKNCLVDDYAARWSCRNLRRCSRCADEVTAGADVVTGADRAGGAEVECDGAGAEPCEPREPPEEWLPPPKPATSEMAAASTAHMPAATSVAAALRECSGRRKQQ